MNRLYPRLALLLTLAMLLTFVPATRADTIGPGESTTNLTPLPGDLPIGSALATISGAYVGAFVGTPTGTYTAEVFRNANGGLDFVYDFQNATGNVVSVSMSDFDNFTTDVFVTGTGNVPALASRPVASILNFSFVGPGVDNTVGPGQSSSTLVIATNAHQFGTGAFGLLGAGTATVQAFAPIGEPIPEPSSMLLFGTGLSACAATLRRRIRKQCGFGQPRA